MNVGNIIDNTEAYFDHSGELIDKDLLLDSGDKLGILLKAIQEELVEIFNKHDEVSFTKSQIELLMDWRKSNFDLDYCLLYEAF